MEKEIDKRVIKYKELKQIFEIIDSCGDKKENEEIKQAFADLIEFQSVQPNNTRTFMINTDLYNKLKTKVIENGQRRSTKT